MAAPTSTSSGGSQPAVLQLAELNQRSASLGSWDVGIFKPRIDEWTYLEKSTKREKKGAAFRCLLVYLPDPSQYVKGEILMIPCRNMKPLEEAKEKFKENKSFHMHLVKFQANTAQEYLHTPQKFVVNLSTTTFDPLMSKAQGEVIIPQPSMTLSEINDLKQNQRFDVTALVEQVEDPLPAGKQNRVRRFVKLIDQAESGSKVQETKWTFFSDAKPSRADSATIDILREFASSNEPLTLFALSGNKSGAGFSIENSRDFFVVKATGNKATQLQDNAKDLRATPAEERDVTEIPSGGVARSYKDEPGRQSFCKLLSTMTGTTHIKSIDGDNTLWQLNWVEIAWPEGDAKELCTKDGSRLFFNTHVRDITGTGPRMRMTEQSALTLSQAPSKEAFLEQHVAGKHTFPAMATAKVLREVQKRKEAESGGSHPAEEEQEYINFTIVEAADQPLNEKPTMATLELIPLMPQVEHDSACILPCALNMVKASSHYAFQIRIMRGADEDPFTIPCQKIICLVKSTKDSGTEPLGAAGFKVVTRDVECMLGDCVFAPGVSREPSKFVLSSTCPVENVTSYKLNPPRRGAQCALVTITGKVRDVFVVDQVQHLTPDEASDAKESLSQLLLLACRTSLKDLKRDAKWSEGMSPATAKRCRTLGRAPTGAPIPSNILATPEKSC